MKKPRLPAALRLTLTLLALAACAAPPADLPPTTAPQPSIGALIPQQPSPAAPTAAALPAAGSPLPTTTPATPTPVPTDELFAPARLSYAHGFYTPQIQAFLEERPGPLKDVHFQIGDRSHSFAEALVGITSLYSVNPQIILALIEQQSRLLSTARPSSDQVAYAVGYSGDGGGRRGLFAQVRWAARELRWAVRDYATRGADLPPLVFADGTRQPPSAGISLSRYTLARVLAPTTTPDRLGARLGAFVDTYTRLFGDPRPLPVDWPLPAVSFLSYPLAEPTPITSFFDHDTPFLQKNGTLLTYWGRTETDIAFAYDGHTGWDYAAAPPDPVLAAAAGLVIFAGNSDDGCGTPARAVILDHGNGYRTLYWHLDSIAVQTGATVPRGATIGIAGSTGCVTGPHLHFQVQYLGRDVDPYGWCAAAADPWRASPAGQVSLWLWADAPNPCGPPPPAVVVVDDGAPGFVRRGEWQANEVGYGGGSLFAPAIQGGQSDEPWAVRSLREPLLAIWQPQLPQAGRYRVLAYVPYALSGLEDSEAMRFLVRHSAGETAASVDANLIRNGWADLGTYTFDPRARPLVSLSTLAGDEGTSIWADAVAWIPVGSQP